MERLTHQDGAPARGMGADTQCPAANDGRRFDDTPGVHGRPDALESAHNANGLVGSGVSRAANLYAAQLPGPLAQTGADAAVGHRTPLRLYPVRPDRRL